MKRVILDTNISEEIVSEYLDILQRPNLHLKSRTIAVITGRIYRKAKFVKPEERVSGIQSDPKDDKFLEAAIAGQVDFIVSGDKHLLNLENFRSIPIITAREFLNQFESNG